MEHLLRQDHKIIPDYVRVYESATGGWVDLHPWHGAQELEDNLATAKILADKGHCSQLLPTLHAHETVLRQHLLPDVFEKKNPDVRIVRVSQNDISDIKTPNKNAVTKTTIKDGIYRAAQQKANVVIINLHQAN